LTTSAGDLHRHAEAKRFADSTDVREFKEIQARLSSAKMRILVCRSNDRPCAATVFSAMGKTALYLFGASNELGRQTMGSFRIHWGSWSASRRRGAGCMT
jgi:lipid II:glycine glycyltransferase (peptidoglycan interpeptide bridge formation enzyme)